MRSKEAAGARSRRTVPRIASRREARDGGAVAGPRRGMRRVALRCGLALALLAGLVSAPAFASDVPGVIASGALGPEEAGRAQWRGRSCGPLGCAPQPGSVLSSLLGFTLAVGVAARCARRSGDDAEDREAP